MFVCAPCSLPWQARHPMPHIAESVSNWHPFPLASWYFVCLFVCFSGGSASPCPERLPAMHHRRAPRSVWQRRPRVPVLNSFYALCVPVLNRFYALCVPVLNHFYALCVCVCVCVCTEQLIGVVSAQRSAFLITILFLLLLLLLISFVCALHSLCSQTHASCSLYRPCKTRLSL
jgi:hypothetical protein